MNIQTINKEKQNSNKKYMGHHDLGAGILGFIGSIIVAIFVTIPHKVIGFLMESATFINPNAREFIVELAPFIGAFTGIIAIIVYLYRIKLYRRQIKEIDDKAKQEKK